MKLELKGISFGYHADQIVLKDISFSYQSPEILCILGTNGTGKSTLLKCITGEHLVSQGEVLVDGRPAREYSARDLAIKMAYLPQSHTPSFAFRVIEVVQMGRTSRMGYFSSPGEQDREIAMEKLGFLGIEHLAEKPYTEISGGERQLVMIAAALAQDPDLIILDEPVSHLDFGNQFRFIKLVEHLQKLNTGVIMTTHFPDHALWLNSRTIILGEGCVQADGPAVNVITEKSMSALYRIQAKIVTVDHRPVCVPLSF